MEISTMSEATLELTDATFEADVEQSELPVLVDFWAPWCAPCRMLTPTIEAIAEEYSGKVRVAKLDTQDNQAVATRLQITGLPTMVLFKGGQQIDRKMGVLSKEAIVEWLNEKVLAES
jgi:thioredoxin 1